MTSLLQDVLNIYRKYPEPDGLTLLGKFGEFESAELISENSTNSTWAGLSKRLNETSLLCGVACPPVVMIKQLALYGYGQIDASTANIFISESYTGDNPHYNVIAHHELGHGVQSLLDRFHRPVIHEFAADAFAALRAGIEETIEMHEISARVDSKVKTITVEEYMRTPTKHHPSPQSRIDFIKSISITETWAEFIGNEKPLGEFMRYAVKQAESWQR